MLEQDNHPFNSSEFVGFHSVIKPVGDSMLSKSFGEKANGFLPDHAYQMTQQMKNYMRIANGLNIPISPIVGMYIGHNGHEGRVNFYQVVERLDHSLGHQIREKTQPKDVIFHQLNQYMEYYNRVWSDDSPISLDPVPDNYCPDENGKLYLVDLMPPRQKTPDGLISEWPEPPAEFREFIEKRYFVPQIQARVVRAQLLRATLGREDISSQEITDMMAKHWRSDWVQASLVSGSEMDHVLSSPKPTDVDTLRVISAEAVKSKVAPKLLADNIYKSCHIGIGGILPTQEVVDIASQLIKHTLSYD